MKTKYTVTIAVLILLSFVIAGCNILGWSHDNENTEDKLADAKYEMEEGNYQESKNLYEEVLEEEPNNSQAHWGVAKANIAMKITLGNIIDIAERLTEDEFPEGERLIIPQDFSYETWTEVQQFLENDVLYHLNRIYDENSDGVIDTTNVSLNISTAMISFLNGVSYLRSRPIKVVTEEGEIDSIYTTLEWRKDNQDENPDKPGTGDWDAKFIEEVQISWDQLDPSKDPIPKTVHNIHMGVKRIIKAIEYTDVSDKELLNDTKEKLKTIELDVAFLDFVG